MNSIEHRSRVGGWAIAAAAAVVALFLYAIHYALLPFVFAAAIGFVLDPPIRRAQARMGGRRWPAAVVLYLLLLAGLAAACYFIGRTMTADVLQLATRAPKIMHGLFQYLVGDNGIALFGKTYTAGTLTRDAFNAAGALLGARAAAGIAGSAIGAVAGMFLTLVLIPFFLISGPRLAAGAIRLLPPERRGAAWDTAQVIAPMLRRYLVGLFLIVVYASLLGWIGFGPVFALPHAALLAITVGLLELLPAIGPMVSAALMAVVALERGSLAAGVVLMAFVIALRLSIDNVVGPLLLGRAARVHPVVVIFSFVCGAMLFGVMGLLLAVPVAASIKIVLDRYYAEPIERHGREPSG